MDLFFNELSIKDMADIDYDSVVTIAKVYNRLSGYGITTCRIAPEDNSRLFQMICCMPDSVNVRNFYFSFFRSPYESKVVEEKQDDYYKHRWICHDEECIGIALAFLPDSASFSIDCTRWNAPFLEFFRDLDSEHIRNICVEEHVDMHVPQIQDKGGTKLLECDMPFSDKKIVLRDDHGKDVLEDFAKRLLHCPYLVGVINSLPYNSHERKFIRRVRENGLIEIVLPWTDQGYGMVVKTTGRTLRETERIAEIIEGEFGYIS